MYCRKYKCCQMQNNYDENMINTACKMCKTNADYYSDNNMPINMNLSDNNSCDCGFDKQDSVFPENPVLGQSYVPIQKLDKTFIPAVGLKMGTIFPELVSPYKPCQSLEEIAFIKAMNTVKEGCNKC